MTNNYSRVRRIREWGSAWKRSWVLAQDNLSF